MVTWMPWLRSKRPSVIFGCWLLCRRVVCALSTEDIPSVESGSSARPPSQMSQTRGLLLLLPLPHGHSSLLPRNNSAIRPCERYHCAAIFSRWKVPRKWEWRRCAIGVLNLDLGTRETIRRCLVPQCACLAPCHTENPYMWACEWRRSYHAL